MTRHRHLWFLCQAISTAARHAWRQNIVNLQPASKARCEATYRWCEKAVLSEEVHWCPKISLGRTFDAWAEEVISVNIPQMTMVADEAGGQHWSATGPAELCKASWLDAQGQDAMGMGNPQQVVQAQRYCSLSISSTLKLGAVKQTAFKPAKPTHCCR